MILLNVFFRSRNLPRHLYFTNVVLQYLLVTGSLLFFQCPVSPDIPLKQSQQQQLVGSANLVKRSKLSRPMDAFAESMHKTMKLSPSHVTLETGQFDTSNQSDQMLKVAQNFPNVSRKVNTVV